MNKSLYETIFYPDTDYRWNIIPGAKYTGETLINFLNQKFSLATKKSGTGIMGVTAGARGALLVAATYSDKFAAAAGISGFYDQSTMPVSKMVESVYGSYKKNQQRWENEDNILKLAHKLKGVSVYIYHGERNDAFNPIQSKLMAIRLKQLENKDSGYSITYKEGKTGGYGWLYWRGQAEPVMEFMNEKLK
jgi:S-formylglutathione hydrolase FrmB